MYQCWSCEYISPSDKDLYCHLKDVHGHITLVEEQQGGEDGERVPSKALCNNHNTQGIKADNCEFTSAAASEFATNQLIVEYVPPQHQCMSCEYVASDDRDLNSHFNYIPGEIRITPVWRQPEVQCDEKASFTDREKGTKVENCSVPSTSAAESLSSAPSARAKPRGTGGRKASPKSSTNPQFLCEQCDFRTNRMQHLAIHAKRHAGKRDQGGNSIDKITTDNPSSRQK